MRYGLLRFVNRANEVLIIFPALLLYAFSSLCLA